MTQGSNAAELDELEMQVQKARHLVQQSEIKVEAIEASIHEIEKFYPKIKIIRRPPQPAETADDAFSLFASTLLTKVA